MCVSAIDIDSIFFQVQFVQYSSKKSVIYFSHLKKTLNDCSKQTNCLTNTKKSDK